MVADGTAAKPVQNVSCRRRPPSACVVSATGNIATFDGTTWTRQPSPGQSLLHSVSCPTPTFCMAVDLTGHALTFDGSTWTRRTRDPGGRRPDLLGVLPDGVSSARWPGPTGRSATWRSGS